MNGSRPTLAPRILLALVALPAAPRRRASSSPSAICSTDQTWCELAAKEFQAHTGIRVQQVRKATGEALAQIRAEAANPKTDLWWGGTGDPFLQAAELGLLDAYRPAYLNDLHGWAVRQYAMSGNFVGGFYTSAIGFGWNEDVLRKKNLPAPKCWSDLIDPKYKGEIETSHPGSSGTGYTILAGLVQMMGEDAAFDYLKKLHRNVTQYTRSGTAQAKSIAKGEVGVGVSFIFGFENERQQGFTMVKSAAPCEGTGYEIGGIALVKGARNREAAQRYYDWLMSPAGQSARREGQLAAVPGEQDVQGRPEDTDARQRAPHQVRLREVRQGGRAQAPARAVGEGSELAASLMC